MSKLDKNNVVTPEEYKELIAKEEPTPIEIMKTKQYEDYIESCKYLEDLDLGFGTNLAPTSSDKIVRDTNEIKLDLINKEDKTEHEEKVLQEFKEKLENTKELEQVNGVSRKLKRTGYADIAIILVALLNIGFIFAMAILRG